MATNIARKRAKKEQQRKLAAAARRRTEAFEASLAGQVHRASRLPIVHCLLSESLFDDGIGSLVLARGPASYDLTLSAFLLDVFCLGIKDVTIRTMTGTELEEYLEINSLASPLKPVEPAYARRLLHELTVWARSIGFPPPRDYAVVERLFGDVAADASEIAFHFGYEGKPLYVAGPTEPTWVVRKRVEQLRRRLGEDGFGFEIPS